MILLDTNALLWATANSRRIGTKTKRRLDNALADGQLAVPTIVFLEAARLHWANRVDLGMSPDIWHRRHIDLGLREIPLTGKIAVAAAALEPRRGFHGDPGDQIVTATALTRGGTLVTSDRAILAWAVKNPSLRTMDATR